MRNQRSIFYNIDLLTVGLYLLLVLLGWINIYAAVYDENHQSILDISQNYGKQLLWIITGLVLATVILIIDASFYSSFAFFIYGGVLLLLIGVLLFGREVAGARSWFEVGSFRLQPAEFAKFATCLAIAKYLSAMDIKFQQFKTKLISAAIICIPALLILLQNDTGSALVYTSFILVLYREGLSGNILLMGFAMAVIFVLALLIDKVILASAIMGVLVIVYFLANSRGKNENLTIAGILLAIVGIVYYFDVPASYGIYAALGLATVGIIYNFVKRGMRNKAEKIVIIAAVIFSTGFIYSVDHIFENVLQQHQRQRINVQLGIETDKQGVGYNLEQSLIAIGSGGTTGKGFLQGTQTKFNFVPEQSTDFIFCTVGEEWGFLGAAVIIILFMALLFRILFLAERQRSMFSRIYAYGVACILFFHFAINVGMTIGLAPIIGIPLPFFSYGGSSLWAFTVLLFILIKLDANRLQVLR